MRVRESRQDRQSRQEGWEQRKRMLEEPKRMLQNQALELVEEMKYHQLVA